MDWREMAGRPTVGHGVSGGSWNPFESAWEGVVRVSQSEVARKGLGGWKASLKNSGSTSSHSSAPSSGSDATGATSAAVEDPAQSSWPPSYALDPMRGWIIAAAWLIACGLDIYYLYTLVRRPTYILDFACTLVLNHLILTTYYSASFPSSLFFWTIITCGAIFVIVFAEQLCVRREMREGLKTVSTNPDVLGRGDEDIEVEEERIELMERNAE